uniref:Uncharacterized protein n=1 Tax=Cacopsylla melanoneura TaxID=428564 RepID=A0A8D9A035_9HEMI
MVFPAVLNWNTSLGIIGDGISLENKLSFILVGDFSTGSTKSLGITGEGIFTPSCTGGELSGDGMKALNSLRGVTGEGVLPESLRERKGETESVTLNGQISFKGLLCLRGELGASLRGLLGEPGGASLRGLRCLSGLGGELETSLRGLRGEMA